MARSDLLRIVSEGELQERDKEDADLQEAIRTEESNHAVEGLAHYVRKRYYDFRHHRTQYFIDDGYTEALRAYNGKYTANKLAEIKKFGGSDVYARITTVKCRGATAMLRDVFLGSDKPWGVEPTPVPNLPRDILGEIDKLIAIEQVTMQRSGQVVPPQQLEDRRTQLIDAAFKALRKQAENESSRVENELEDILVEGGFYDALAEFLIDLPIFDMACIKGPIVQNRTDVSWVGGEMKVVEKPAMSWRRVSPFDLYLDPGAGSDISKITIMERIKVTRAELNQLIGVPGYHEDAIRLVLNDYGRGLYDWLDDNDTERTDLEGREDPQFNRAEMIDTLEFHGPVQGKLLLEQGFTPEQIPEPETDYFVTCWVIGRHVIKTQINPNPRKRHPYYITSFEKIPGSPYGHGLPVIIGDIQSVANASLRALVNNMSIASGPQVAINEERLSPTTDPDSIFPWKRWRFLDSDTAGQQTPITFFQPSSNANELLGVYHDMANLADEISAIPRYMTGSDKVGGAGDTASGLSMLMNNASKVLQMVAANVDRDIFGPLLRDLYEFVMLTDTEKLFNGDERIVVKGVEVAMQKETDRVRQLEFLSITGNPIDMNIVGVKGRAAILRTLAGNLGMPGETIIPTEEELTAKEEEQRKLQMMEQAAAQAQGDQATAPGSTGAGRIGEETDNMQRVRQNPQPKLT